MRAEPELDSNSCGNFLVESPLLIQNAGHLYNLSPSQIMYTQSIDIRTPHPGTRTHDSTCPLPPGVFESEAKKTCLYITDDCNEGICTHLNCTTVHNSLSPAAAADCYLVGDNSY